MNNFWYDVNCHPDYGKMFAKYLTNCESWIFKRYPPPGFVQGQQRRRQVETPGSLEKTRRAHCYGFSTYLYLAALPPATNRR